MRRALGLGVGLALVAWAVWAWTRMTPPVTEAEARRHLNRIVAAAQRGDLAGVCRLNGSSLQCERMLDVIGRDRVPTQPPTVVGTRYVRKAPGATAGRVLVVEGVDGRGDRYRTEVFVFRESRFSFTATNAVYWSGATLIEGDTFSPAASR